MIRYLVQYLIECSPIDADPTFKEANIDDPVYAATNPILFDLKKTGHNCIKLQREKIVSPRSGAEGTRSLLWWT